MKYLLTICPRCRARFYVKVSSEPTLSVTCPYCRMYYHDRTDLGNIKEADYAWELYRGLYPRPDNDLGDRKMLKICGGLLLASIPFFLIPLLYISLVAGNAAGEYSSTIIGVAFAGFIYLAIILAGAFSSINTYSFAVSLTGSIFAVLNSFLVALLMTYRAVTDEYCFAMLFPLLLAFIAMSMILKNKKGFSTGY